MGDLEGFTLALLHHGQGAHLADAGARFGREQHAGREGFLKYFLALTNKKKADVSVKCHYIWKEKSRAK